MVGKGSRNGRKSIADGVSESALQGHHGIGQGVLKDAAQAASKVKASAAHALSEVAAPSSESLAEVPSPVPPVVADPLPLRAYVRGVGAGNRDRAGSHGRKAGGHDRAIVAHTHAHERGHEAAVADWSTRAHIHQHAVDDALADHVEGHARQAASQDVLRVSAETGRLSALGYSLHARLLSGVGHDTLAVVVVKAKRGGGRAAHTLSRHHNGLSPVPRAQALVNRAVELSC